jgi:hypothetical protein
MTCLIGRSHISRLQHHRRQCERFETAAHRLKPFAPFRERSIGVPDVEGSKSMVM